MAASDDTAPEPAVATPSAGDHAADAVHAVYRQVLLRDAEPDQLHALAALLRAGDLDLQTLIARLRDSGEFRTVIAPIAARVRAVHGLFHGRQPTTEELARHVSRCRQTLGTDEAVRAAAAAGGLDVHLGIRPLNVEMDVTNQCNIRCTMCYFSDPTVGNRKRQDLTAAQYARIADQMFAFVHRLCLAFGTEPLIHPHLVDFVRLGKQRLIPKVYFNTNAVRLTADTSAGLIDAGLDTMNVSFDAGTKATYERVRRGARFDVVLDNLRTLRRLKQERRTVRPHVSMSFVMMRSTIDELPEFVRVAHDVGAEAVHLLHLVPYDTLGTAVESLASEPARCNELVGRATEVAAQFGLRVCVPDSMDPSVVDPAKLDFPRARRNYDLPLDEADEQRGCCPFPWHFLALDQDGTVMPCGWWHAGARMGNLFEQDFAAIWQGEVWRRLRADLAAGVLGHNCQRCPASGMGSAKASSSFASRDHTWRRAAPTEGTGR